MVTKAYLSEDGKDFLNLVKISPLKRFPGGSHCKVPATENVIIGRPVMAKPNYKMETASSVQKKDKTADRTPRRLCVSHSSSIGPSFAGRGRVISGHLANRFGSRFGTDTKLFPGVIKPISTPNDYLNTVFESRY